MSEKFKIDSSKLSALEKKFHRVMMLNELFAGRGAYELQHARLAQSGYSFGPVQWDLSQRAEARKKFKQILKEAGKVSRDEIASIMKRVRQKDAHFSSIEIKKINKSLGSAEGRLIIEEFYLEELEQKLNRIEELLTELAKDEYRDFLESEVAQLFLLDYHNQFDISPGGEMEEFLTNGKVTIGRGRTVQVDGSLGLGDLLNFYFNTYYGQRHPQDLLRRFNNILTQVEIEQLDLPKRDFKKIVGVLNDKQDLISKVAAKDEGLNSLWSRATRLV